MLVVTTPSLEGRVISQYLGLVSGEAILGANIFRDLFAGIRDIVGGRSAAYEEELRKAHDLIFEKLPNRTKTVLALPEKERKKAISARKKELKARAKVVESKTLGRAKKDK